MPLIPRLITPLNYAAILISWTGFAICANRIHPSPIKPAARLCAVFDGYSMIWLGAVVTRLQKLS